jgi:hypothetical protein
MNMVYGDSTRTEKSAFVRLHEQREVPSRKVGGVIRIGPIADAAFAWPDYCRDRKTRVRRCPTSAAPTFLLVPYG